MKRRVFFQGYTVVCALGSGNAAVAARLFRLDPPALGRRAIAAGRVVPVGEVDLSAERLERPDGRPESRNNRLAECCLRGLDGALFDRLRAVAPSRLGVVVGTSTAGIAEGGEALSAFLRDDAWPDDFDLSIQELGDPALFLSRRLGAKGPAYSVSTACTSGAKALISAARLIEESVCDVVVCGGVDTLCEMTLSGFGVLEALSGERCNPFSVNRGGIHIGEGAALFVLSTEAGPIRMAGWGESSDAYHISAPDPEGAGAELAMRRALERAELDAADIAYVNLHGTATRHNDLMEARAVARVFDHPVPCSSTKPMTGHMLGAAGACEAAFTALALEHRCAPVHCYDGEFDPEIAPLSLTTDAEWALEAGAAMSCNYAFGGNNIALVLEPA